MEEEIVYNNIFAMDIKVEKLKKKKFYPIKPS